MSQHIPSAAFDLERYLLDTLGNTHDGATVRNVKPSLSAPYRCVVISAMAQGRATPISRYVRLTVAGWDVRASHAADIAGAQRLAGGYAIAVEMLSGLGPVLVAEIESGPYRVTDSESGTEYAVANLLLEVSF